MVVQTLDPLTDPRWAAFLAKHPSASVFHTPAWLETLRRTYGYEPIVYTTSKDGEPLTNGLVLCGLRSRLSGRRLVGVPFADHCEPLIERGDDQEAIANVLRQLVQDGTWKSVELRPRQSAAIRSFAWSNVETYCFHSLDLDPSIETLRQATHKDSIQRKVRRAERDGLCCEVGRSDELLDRFYRLLILTRRRHRLPPQPREWFHNLLNCMRDRVTIHVAYLQNRAIGAIITLQHSDTLVYKYGASDAAFHNSGCMPLLFWNAILEAKRMGLRRLDLGRSEPGNRGLIAFKDHLGTARSVSSYVRFPVTATASTRIWLPAMQVVFARLPDKLLEAAGKLLYRHIG